MPRRVGGNNGQATHYLRDWRKGKRLTQEELAERAGTTKATISRTEGGTQTLMPAALKLYADIMGTHPSIILNRPPLPEECAPFKAAKGAGAKRQEAHRQQRHRRQRAKILSR